MPVLSQAAANGSTIGATTLWAVPFLILTAITVKALGCRITTSSAAHNIQLGIYASNNTTGRPTGVALATTGNISTASTGTVSATLTGGGTVTLNPGIYWAAIMADNAVAVVMSMANVFADMAYLFGSASLANLNAGSASFCLNVAVGSTTFGTWPTLTSATFVESNTYSAPLILLQSN